MAASSTPGAGAAEGLALKDLSSLRQQFPPACLLQAVQLLHCLKPAPWPPALILAAGSP